ncbi:hypothetical protein Lal_00049396 [Lupinus albus]|nr:hypothetical protein Lal_00049396 [Lupinus albus]
MAERRPKRVKTISNHPRRAPEVGGPSSAPPGRTTKKRDPFFSPEFQATRLSQFRGRKLAYVQYADISWLVEQGFQFPHELETQDANPFIELHEVGGLSSTGEPLGDCNNLQWDSFEVVVLYESFLRDTMKITPGEQPTAQPEAAEASQAPPFGVAHLVTADIQRETDQNKAEIDKIAFMLQLLTHNSNPPPSNKPSYSLSRIVDLFSFKVCHHQKGEIEITSTSEIATFVSCLCFGEDKVDLKSLKT